MLGLIHTQRDAHVDNVAAMQHPARYSLFGQSRRAHFVAEHGSSRIAFQEGVEPVDVKMIRVNVRDEDRGQTVEFTEVAGEHARVEQQALSLVFQDKAAVSELA
jgi:hypothetical protein